MQNRCGKHQSEARGFCALDKGHEGDCDIYPEVKKQGIVIDSTVVEVRTQIELYRGKITKLSSFEHEFLTRTKIKCLGWTVGSIDGCGKEFLIGELEYIQTYWYTTI